MYACYANIRWLNLFIYECIVLIKILMSYFNIINLSFIQVNISFLELLLVGKTCQYFLQIFFITYKYESQLKSCSKFLIALIVLISINFSLKSNIVNQLKCLFL